MLSLKSRLELITWHRTPTLLHRMSAVTIRFCHRPSSPCPPISPPWAEMPFFTQMQLANRSWNNRLLLPLQLRTHRQCSVDQFATKSSPLPPPLPPVRVAPAG